MTTEEQQARAIREALELARLRAEIKRQTEWLEKQQKALEQWRQA